MQRWMLVALVGVLLLGVGGGFALWTYRQNKADRIWVPLALNAELPADKRAQLATEIKTKLLEGTIIADAVKDVGLAGKLDLPSSEAAEAEVRQRLFVEVGEAAAPTGVVVPSINVGLSCQKKTSKAMGEVAMRLMEDVWKMLGIKRPQASDTF